MVAETNDVVRIFDTTLRDGEQSPGATLTRPEKLEIAKQLELLGVDVIEAGFPASSVGDFESVAAIAGELQKAVVCGLARCVPGDIERAGMSIKGAAHGRIHLFLATSKIHREHKLKKGKEDILRIGVESIHAARQYTSDVEFSPEDASRTELEFLEEMVAAAVEAGATTINLPDTVGFATPAGYGHVFSHLLEKLPVLREKRIVLSAHCHNDLGMAVANSLSAVANGARQVECTINGIGERAGNAALEEIIMALRTRPDVFKFKTGIDISKIFPTSRMVSTLTGLAIARNKPVVGSNAFAHEAGIHQDGMLKHRETYEIMDPTALGIPKSSLVLGKHSGRAAFKDRLIGLGYSLTEPQIEAAFGKFKTLADKKKDIFDEDLEAMVDDQMQTVVTHWKLAGVQVVTGSTTVPTATVAMTGPDGQTMVDASVGDGPVDAIFAAIGRLTGVRLELTDYRIRSISKGRDAQGEATVEVNHDGRTLKGRGLSTDILEASALAYVSAVNRIRSIASREKQVDSGAYV